MQMDQITRTFIAARYLQDIKISHGGELVSVRCLAMGVSWSTAPRAQAPRLHAQDRGVVRCVIGLVDSSAALVPLRRLATSGSGCGTRPRRGSSLAILEVLSREDGLPWPFFRFSRQGSAMISRRQTPMRLRMHRFAALVAFRLSLYQTLLSRRIDLRIIHGSLSRS